MAKTERPGPSATRSSRCRVESQGEPLRSDVDEVDLAGEQCRLDRAALVGPLRGVEVLGAHADCAERIHLVVHQRDERRDHEPRAAAHECGDLVAERLARPGGHEHEGVAPGHDAVDDLALPAPERLVAEHPLQHLERGFSGDRHAREGSRRVGHPGLPVEDGPVRADRSRVTTDGERPGLPLVATSAPRSRHQWQHEGRTGLGLPLVVTSAHEKSPRVATLLLVDARNGPDQSWKERSPAGIGTSSRLPAGASGQAHSGS